MLCLERLDRRSLRSFPTWYSMILYEMGYIYAWTCRIKQHSNICSISRWFTLVKNKTKEHKPQSLPKAKTACLPFIFVISFSTEKFYGNRNFDTIPYIFCWYSFEFVTWQCRFSTPTAALSSQSDRTIQCDILSPFPRRLMELRGLVLTEMREN